MKKRFTLGMVMALMLLVAVVTATISFETARRWLNEGLRETEQERQRLSKIAEIMNYVDNFFVGPWDEKTVTDNAARGLVGGLGDRWSHYLSAEEFEAYRDGSSNQTVGIGIGVTQNEAEDALLVTEVYTDSPAEETGMRPGDEIIAIDGELVSELGYYVAVERARGEENTRINLTLRRAGGRIIDVQTFRRMVAVEAVRSEILDGDIGYVRVRNFHSRVDDDFATAIDRLLEAEVGGLVIDMRYNPGGELNVLVPMLDKLLPEGVIITLRNKAGVEDVRRSEPGEVALPMVVLINGESYSAAEFFAAALREYDKAVLVGENTSGKGYSQSTTELADGSALLLSTNEYFTPDGESLAGVGLTPDITVASDDGLAFFAHDREKDKPLQRAVQSMRDTLDAAAAQLPAA